MSGLAVVALVCSARAATDGLALGEAPPPELRGRVELTTDPRRSGAVVTVELRHDARLYDASVSGGDGGTLMGLRAGESVWVEGSVRSVDGDDGWRRSRHIAGRVTLTTVAAPQAASGLWGFANGVHRAVRRTTAGMTEDRAGLVQGLALGDRGAVSEALAGDMRVAGLSHLTAASGQHVLLLMAMASPLLSRLGPVGRLLAAGLLLATFVVLTRAEPSVLRAAAMAFTVIIAGVINRPVHGIDALSVAVAVLIVVDPLIIGSVGFQLSVVAAGGIALLAHPIAASVTGPRAVAAAIGVTVAAQVAVAPLIAATFGSVPLIGVVANLLVAPFIGPLMAWTLVAGTVAGVLTPLAGIVSFPLEMMAAWVVGVAQWCARLPLSGLDTIELLVAGLAAVVALVGWRRRHAVIQWVGVVGVGCALLGGSLRYAAVPAGVSQLGAGATLVTGESHTVLIVDGRVRTSPVSVGLRHREVRSIEAVVVRTSSVGAHQAAQELCQPSECVRLVPPSSEPGPGIVVVTGSRSLDLGSATVRLQGLGDQLKVEITGGDD